MYEGVPLPLLIGTEAMRYTLSGLIPFQVLVLSIEFTLDILGRMGFQLSRGTWLIALQVGSHLVGTGAPRSRRKRATFPTKALRANKLSIATLTLG